MLSSQGELVLGPLDLMAVMAVVWSTPKVALIKCKTHAILMKYDGACIITDHTKRPIILVLFNHEFQKLLKFKNHHFLVE
jgi:hypothetical protein